MANFLNEAAKKALESNIPFIRNKANETIIETLANKVEPRPRPFSMAGNGGEYTTWRGLTDRKFSGRQLPPAADEYVQSLPPMEGVVALFKREKEELDGRTSLLLPVFAQWFTDSFLRTKWQPPAEQDFAYNESNHEIDLNQIYGSAEEQTNMLRSMKGGRLKSQTINGEEWPVFSTIAKHFHSKSSANSKACTPKITSSVSSERPPMSTSAPRLRWDWNMETPPLETPP